MRGGLMFILFFVIVGVMLAQIISNPKGTKTVFDGVNTFWSTSINGLLGNGSKGGN